MKIRKGFVSNSSSSSFICDVCGEKFTGYDASPSEFGCSVCPNEHIICSDHLKDTPDIDPELLFENGCEHEFDRSTMKFCPECGSKARVEIDTDGFDLHPLQCPVCRLDIYSEHEMAKYLEKTRKVTREEVFVKVKEMNRRRRKLYNAEYITHVCEKFELNDDILMKEVKDKFGTWDKYIEFIWAK